MTLEMSVVIFTPDEYATIRRTIQCLAAQTVAAQLELIIVVPSKQSLELVPADVAGFGVVTIVEVGAILSTTTARLAGARAARALIVAFAEDHIVFNSQWAEALINAHRREYAVVGGVFGNANPASLISWANLLIEYGDWMEPTARTMRHLPGHNSAYKKDLLLAYGSELESKFVCESVLHWDMIARGHTLYFEPRAKIYHLNHSRLAPSLRLRFYAGAVFAGARSRDWSILKRLAFFAGAPLIPFVRFFRLIRNLRRVETARARMPQVLPLVFVALLWDAAGEAIGYTLRPDQFEQKLSAMEYHRERYLNAKDLRAWRAGALNGTLSR